MFKEGILMKRKLVLGFVFLFVFGFSSFSCYAQSSNREQRLIGTWVHELKGSTLVFNPNGTYSFQFDSTEWEPKKYGAAENIIVFIFFRPLNNRNEETIGECFISSDGKTLILRGLAGGLNGLYFKR